ncbi:NAD(P)-dependent oxidoreductase [Paracoccus aminophilus]|uniref:D-3-phosphoglycerate dehydrogenase n=1 Tax=Paracoccus aminophilus JCM 7686 TaxID=1367847 RepID=S5XTQ0_PARAH|nr:NAD(P)-dependent oxidoreductase [Paracoccus aminophilus]AGT08542.1 D-3-phosphoglycerate dehydrogenase [Paracoccus aminophilus JCM 7686]
MKTCLIVQPIHSAGLDLLRRNGIEPRLAPTPDMATVAALLPGCDAVITRDAGLKAEAFAAADRLQIVVIHGTGHDSVDKAAAAAKRVLVANTPGVNARSVAELALGLALAVARGIPAADRSTRAGAPGFRESARFTELSGKTALIVGWGAIGRDLGRMLDQAFGMRILVHSPRAPETGGYARVSLAEGLAEADLISLHTPMRDETRNLIGAEALAQVKPGAILVNVARAGLVDEAALDRALAEGRLAGAGLDVYSEAAPQGPLVRHANVIFTPHLGATTEDALRRVAEAAAGHVITALAGGMPETALNPEVRP